MIEKSGLSPTFTITQTIQTQIHLKTVIQLNNQLIQYYIPAQYGPPSGQDPFLDTYRNSIINEFLKEMDHPKLCRKKNFTNKEYQAMRDLHNNCDITIKLVDKGGSTVIMNTVDYVKEGQRQLFNQEHYKTLDRYPTISYNRYITSSYKPGMENGNHTCDY